MIKITDTAFVCASVAPTQMPTDGAPEFAFVGRSNVGKSSLLNMLLGRKNLVKTSKKPGKTITINFFSVNKAFYLVDLPGYGFAKRSKREQAKWAAFIEEYLVNRRSLQRVFILIDSRRGVMESDEEMIAFLEYHRLPYALIYTKADKLGKNAQRALQKKGVFVTAAPVALGRESVWEYIEEHL